MSVECCFPLGKCSIQKLKSMVTITNFKERQREDGTTFFVLEVQGGIEMVKSQQTGNFYATAKKATLSSTFDEATCKGLIGTQMPGSIQKIECEPYEYTVKETGEVLLLNHRYAYVQEESVQVNNSSEFANPDMFSKEWQS